MTTHHQIFITNFSRMEKEEALEMLNREMLIAAERLEFEKAAQIRDDIEKLMSTKKRI